MKTESIVDPNDHIFAIQRRFMDMIRKALPQKHVELVGGMAVPMTGRPELDILIISEDVEGDTERIKSLGLEHRAFADDASFLKLPVEAVDVTVQIMRPDNKMIAIHRGLITLLRKDEKLRQEYEAFKRTLAGLERYEYKQRKIEYLKANILPRL